MSDIIELLERRDERALELLRESYGTYCHAIVIRLLGDEGEAEEAMNDLWMQVWNTIPPTRPRHLKAYLAQTARNIAINRIRSRNTAKRGGATLLLEELTDCIPDRSWDDRMQAGELRESLNGFLRSLPEQERKIFVRRYWFGETVPQLAVVFHSSESRITSLLHRLRKRLKKISGTGGLMGMNQMELFDELTYIDDDLILEAHETPVSRRPHRRSGLRRAVVLLAAVVTILGMSVMAVATMTEDLDARLSRLWNQMIEKNHTGYFGYENNNWIELRRDTESLDDREIEIGYVCVYSLHHAEVRAVCEGETVEVKLEAMVLMEDGQVKYKSRTVQGEGEVTVTLDDLIAGEPGTIVHIQRTTSLLGEEGWEALSPWNSIIASHFDCQIPVGIDIRFPDMKQKYGNYDGRVIAETTDLTEPAETEVQVIVPKGTNMVVEID